MHYLAKYLVVVLVITLSSCTCASKEELPSDWQVPRNIIPEKAKIKTSQLHINGVWKAFFSLNLSPLQYQEYLDQLLKSEGYRYLDLIDFSQNDSDGQLAREYVNLDQSCSIIVMNLDHGSDTFVYSVHVTVDEDYVKHRWDSAKLIE